MTKALKPDALNTLIAGYPSHGFVIDRKEAEKLFNKVYKPCDKLYQLIPPFEPSHFNLLGQNPPIVFRKQLEDNVQKDTKNEEPTKNTSNDSGETERAASSTRIEPTPKPSGKKRNRSSSTSL